LVNGPLLAVGIILKDVMIFYMPKEFPEVLPGHAKFLLELPVVQFVKKPVQAVRWLSYTTTQR